MRLLRVGIPTVLLLAAVVLSAPRAVRAQNGDETSPSSSVAGVVVDAHGLLQKKSYRDPGGYLTRQRIAAAKATLQPKLARFSKLRCVSLNRLEAAIRGREGVASGEMRYLAGLLRLRYVFLYPESGDIVVAGEAEGWITNPAGRVIGITSQRPVLQLQDLVVALRAFPPDGGGTQVIGCSIDPTEEGLAAMQHFLRSIGSRATPGDTRYIVDGLRTSLGLQTVSIDGVSPKTHFAQVMVEADYRMKLIGIGLERPPVRLVSFVDRANPAAVSRNALQRWFFTPDYQCVRVSDDAQAMQLLGDGVKLIGENELVTADGQRRAAAGGNAASRAFVTGFTKKYSALAERSPVYAELRNLIDMAVAAAFIQQEDYYGKTDWRMELFGDENAFAVETYNVPNTVATAVNAVWKGRRLMTPIGGGVSVQPRRALDPENVLDDEHGKVAELHKQTKLRLAKDQWWWD